MHNDDLEPNTVITAKIGSSVTALEVLAAEKMRAWAFDFLHELFSSQNLTFIATPTVAVVAPELTDAAMILGENNVPLVMKLLKYIFLANFLGMPGYTVPVDYIKSANHELLPVGFHLLGNHWSEHQLLRIANALDKDFQTNYIRPPFYTDILKK